MNIIILLTILLCGVCFSEDGYYWVRLSDYDYDIYKETGKAIFNGDMKDVVFNDEAIAKIEARNGDIFADSFKNGLVTLAVQMSRYGYGKPYTMMYTIDVKSKTIVKEEQLKTIHTYKDSNLEFSIIWKNDTNAVMQYTWKGKRHKVTLPSRESHQYFPIQVFYDGFGNAHLVLNVSASALYVFSVAKKKLTWLGYFRISCCRDYDYYFPLNEYVIYYPSQGDPWQKPTGNVFLYRYAEDALYITRYRKVNREIIDSIHSNIENGNTYEQFLPLTKVENMDSLVRNFCEYCF